MQALGEISEVNETIESEQQLVEASRRQMYDQGASGDVADVALAARMLLLQEKENLVCYLQLKKLVLRKKLGEHDPAQAPARKRPATPERTSGSANASASEPADSTAASTEGGASAAMAAEHGRATY